MRTQPSQGATSSTSAHPTGNKLTSYRARRCQLTEFVLHAVIAVLCLHGAKLPAVRGTEANVLSGLTRTHSSHSQQTCCSVTVQIATAHRYRGKGKKSDF
eukprot:55721-Eustigmatos_ZCMA.PRE.1